MKKSILITGLLVSVSLVSMAQQKKTEAKNAVVGMENPGMNPGGNAQETLEKQRQAAEIARKREAEVAQQPDADKKKYIAEKKAAIMADKSISKKDKQQQMEALKKMESGQTSAPVKTTPAGRKAAHTKKVGAPVKP